MDLCPAQERRELILPYYPPGSGQGPPGHDPRRDEKPAASRRSRLLRIGVCCLAAALVLFGGIRLISYGLDLESSRKTKYEMLSSLQTAEPAAGESAAGSGEEDARARIPEAGENAGPSGNTAAGAEPAAAKTLTRSEMSVPLSDLPVARALAEGIYVSTDLPVVEYGNNYEVVPHVQQLKRKSEYVVGWLKMDDLEEPVVQKDNSFFLTHDAMGKKNPNGAIFLDESTGLLTRPYTLLLYGHNMKSGNMFGNLRKFEDFSYCFAHRIFQFDTLFEEGRYVIFAAETISVTPGKGKYVNLYALQSMDRETRGKVLKSLMDYSAYDSMLDVNEEDQLLLLITCVGNDDERLIVAARRLRDNESPERLTMKQNHSAAI